MGSVTDEMNEIQSISSLNYLGKGVTANGKSIALADGEASTIYVDLAEEAAELTINIFDSNGNIVNSYIYNNVAEGMVPKLRMSGCPLVMMAKAWMAVKKIVYSSNFLQTKVSVPPFFQTHNLK